MQKQKTQQTQQTNNKQKTKNKKHHTYKNRICRVIHKRHLCIVVSVVTFNSASEQNVFKPVAYVKNTNVHISKIAIGTETIEVEIFSKNGDTVYTGKIEKEGNILGKIYDFSTSDKGSYTIIMKTNGRRFVENIQI